MSEGCEMEKPCSKHMAKASTLGLLGKKPRWW